MKLYIGCSLTQAPAEFIAAIAQVQANLRVDFEVLDFLGLVKGTPSDVYERDIGRNIATCDLFVAICDYPSIGLGYELATAIEKWRKPVLALAQTDRVITRLVVGISAPSFSMVRYQEIGEIPGLVRAHITSLNHK